MTIRSPILIDTNLLVLLVVGLLDPALVAVHKNCSTLTPEDHALLVAHIGSTPRFVVLPNILNETSNLLRQIRDPYKTQLSGLLQRFIETQREVYVESRSAVGGRDYARLGLTDSAALSIPGAYLHLLTVDFDLYMGFLSAGRPATYFWHVIEGRSR